MISNLKKRIVEANDAYRLGVPIMSDKVYDGLVDELSKLSPSDELLTKIGHATEDESRKQKLPIVMASMNKIKTIEDIDDWSRLRDVPKSTLVILTPKYDGLALCVDESNGDVYTRGDGIVGQKSNEHYDLIGNKLISNESLFQYTYGEVMIAKRVFTDKYSTQFANPRNLVAGLLNSKTPTDKLKDCKYIKYGISNEFRPHFQSKKQVIEFLNKNQESKVKYKICRISDITEDLMIELFKEWSEEFEIDGIIIEVNDLNHQRVLGRETSSKNPVFARAFKHNSFEQTATTQVLDMTWNVSKHGLVKPIVNINPVQLDGVKVSNVTGNNARFVKEMGIGIGAVITIKRSGMVIPLIVDVLERVDFEIPLIEGSELEWNENGIELITKTETDEQKIKKIIAFFEILGADNVSDGTIRQLWDANYRSIKDVLSLSIDDLLQIDRFGKKKAEKVYNSFKKSVTDVRLSKLQHATGIFKGLGSKKLALLEHFKHRPSVEEVKALEGFADTSANVYVDSFDVFFEFIKDLPVTISYEDKNIESENLKGKSFVFTGVRRKDLNEIIESNGGKVSTSVSKNTTYLVVKELGSGSSKEVKATSLGIEILSVEGLEKILNEI